MGWLSEYARNFVNRWSDEMLCIKCGKEMESGYGLAGGGIGPYFYCETPGCGGFVRFQDPEIMNEDNCSGHVASDHDPKICKICGIHIDSLRPEEQDGP